jgi:hypothetical protein
VIRKRPLLSSKTGPMANERPANRFESLLKGPGGCSTSLKLLQSSF